MKCITAPTVSSLVAAAIAFFFIGVALKVVLVSTVFAQDPQGHLVLRDATNKAIPAIFRPSASHASNDLMAFEERCIEVFDLDGDHLHWAPYDLVSGAIAYYPSPCMPEPPEFWFDAACTQGLADPGDKVAFYHVGHQTHSRSSVAVTYAMGSAYSLKTGFCTLVTFASPRDLVSLRPMTDTTPWPVALPGKKPFYIEVIYD